MTELTPTSVRARVREGLAAPALEPIKAALQELRVNDAHLIGLVTGVNNYLVSQEPLIRVREAVARAAGEAAAAAFPRYVLLLAAAEHVADVPLVPVEQDVQRLLLEEFVQLVSATGQEQDWFALGRPNFGAMCKMFTLRRFPAGHFHWEVSGLPRSTFLRVGGLDRARLIRAAWRLGGLAPLFVPHMPWRRHLMLSERQQHLAYFRLAEAMRRQPQIRGMLAEAWFHAPDTPKVSPHLAFVNRIFHEWGGVVLDSGPAGEDSGVFVSGTRRRQLAAEGRFAPRLGLVIWPRQDMLRWAAHYAGLREAV
jgi:hypothetical protein